MNRRAKSSLGALLPRAIVPQAILAAPLSGYHIVILSDLMLGK